MNTFLFALVAISINNPEQVKTIQYFPTISTCQEWKNEVEKTSDPNLIKLQCKIVQVRGH